MLQSELVTATTFANISLGEFSWKMNHLPLRRCFRYVDADFLVVISLDILNSYPYNVPKMGVSDENNKILS